ncbi:MAG: hypothetical protein LUF92_02410 [Clostridiales bacterium]|nr:hypothetical protein [Clostridiales bacterium]MCD8018460.1 hypothetical protein [Clostridiales bacterium]
MKDTKQSRQAIKVVLLLFVAIVAAGGIFYGVTSGSGKTSDLSSAQESDVGEVDASISSHESEEDAAATVDDESAIEQDETTGSDQADTTGESMMMGEEEVDWDDSDVDEDALQEEYDSLEEENVTFPIVP